MLCDFRFYPLLSYIFFYSLKLDAHFRLHIKPKSNTFFLLFLHSSVKIKIDIHRSAKKREEYLQ